MRKSMKMEALKSEWLEVSIASLEIVEKDDETAQLNETSEEVV